MTISVTNPVAGPFTPNGVTTDFPFSFKIMSTNEIQVVDASENVIDLGYSVTIASSGEGGTVSFGSPPAASVGEFYIQADPAFGQPTLYGATTTFNPGSLNNPTDRLAAQNIILKNLTDRGIRYPIGETTQIMPAAADRAGKFFAHDADGKLIMSSGTGADAGLRTDLAAETGTTLVKAADGNTVQENLDHGGRVTIGTTAIETQSRIAQLSVSVVDYGATGDGATDDRAAIQAAIEAVAAAGGGEVYFPPLDVASGKYYRISLPMILRSNVRLRGQGDASLVYNDNTSTTYFGQQFCFLPGLYHPAYFNALPKDAINAVTQGAKTVTLTAGALAAGAYPVGATVATFTDQHIVSGTFNIPIWQRLNEIVARDPATGILTLKYAADRTPAGSLYIAVTDTTAVKYTSRDPSFANEGMFVCKRAGISDMAFRSVADVMSDAATFECLFENISMRGRRGWYGNSFCYTLVRNIRMDVVREGTEISCNSHDLLMQNMTYTCSSYDASNFQFISFNEQPCRVVLDGFTIHAGPFAAVAPLLRIGASEDCEMRNGRVVAPSAASQLLAFENSTVSSGTQPISRRNAFRNIQVIGGGASSNAVYYNLGDPSYAEDCAVVDCEFPAAGAYGFCGLVSGTRSIVKAKFGSTTAAKLIVSSVASRCRIEGGELYGGIQLNAASLVNSNVIGNNKGNGFDSARAGLWPPMLANVAITATTADTVYETATIPASSLVAGDVIYFEIDGRVTGSTVDKTVRIYATPTGGGELAKVAFLAADGAGDFTLRGRIKMTATNNAASHVEIIKSGTLSKTVKVMTPSYAADFPIDLRAWKSATGDGLIIDHVRMTIYRPGQS